MECGKNEDFGFNFEIYFIELSIGAYISRGHSLSTNFSQEQWRLFDNF